jgi:hypothetical protein
MRADGALGTVSGSAVKHSRIEPPAGQQREAGDSRRGPSPGNILAANYYIMRAISGRLPAGENELAALKCQPHRADDP